MRTRSLLAALCFLLPVAASASPIESDLVSDSLASSRTQVIGTLNADLDADLVGVQGNVLIDGLGSLDVADGGSTSSYHSSLFGSFNFSSFSWNSYFSFWGGNWGYGCYSYTSCKLLLVRLRGTITPPTTDIPEPSAALLFGAGAFVVSRRVSRRR